jgi:hypothetical protein
LATQGETKSERSALLRVKPRGGIEQQYGDNHQQGKQCHALAELGKTLGIHGEASQKFEAEK